MKNAYFMIKLFSTAVASAAMAEYIAASSSAAGCSDRVVTAATVVVRWTMKSVGHHWHKPYKRAQYKDNHGGPAHHFLVLFV